MHLAHHCAERSDTATLRPLRRCFVVQAISAEDHDAYDKAPGLVDGVHAEKTLGSMATLCCRGIDRSVSAKPDLHAN